jgi:hypothetical protein
MPDEAAHGVRAGNVAARRDIRLAEAARMLGLLDSGELPERATRWLADGADTPNIRALAAITSVAESPRFALVREITEELGLGFASQQAARTFEAEEIIRARSFNLDVSAQLYGLSNGFTDEMVRRLRGFVSRLTAR